MNKEYVEEVMKEFINNVSTQHTFKLMPSNNRELFLAEIEKKLSIFLEQAITKAYKEAEEKTKKANHYGMSLAQYETFRAEMKKEVLDLLGGHYEVNHLGKVKDHCESSENEALDFIIKSVKERL